VSYQGHLPDGSSIQRHSAGGLYPLVVVHRDNPALPVGMMVPSGFIHWFSSHAKAHDWAERYAGLVRDSAINYNQERFAP
jgi:hypothetical protein